ncbi:MAG: molybdopterin oxidoreductase family protein [Acidobacteriota bacterium]
MPRTHYRACTLCEAICGLEIQVDGGAVTSIRGDADDPFSRGHICPKGVAMQDLQTDPDRLHRPLLKVETSDGTPSWREIPWDEAYDRAVEGLRGVQARHGRDAIGVYLGNPNVHNYGSLLFGPPVLRALRTKHRYSATSVDQLPSHLAAWSMYGHMMLIPVPDLDRTDFFLCLGGNPAVSNGSLMTAPDVKKRLKAVRARGGRIVVVDPRRTETARLAEEHLFVRPGTDALLLAAFVRQLFADDLVAIGRLESSLSDQDDGLAAVRAVVEPFTPEAVAPATGVDPETLRALVRDFAAAPSAVCYGRVGLSMQSFGGLCQWLIQLINLLTGNLDREGGAMLTHPAVDTVMRKRGGGSLGRWRSIVRGLPEFAGELPAATMAEDMLDAGEASLRGFLTVAGNPVLSTPDGRRLDEALGGLEFMVSIDFYLNETTRHADLILPPTPPLEHGHYDLAFNQLAIRDVAKFSEPVFTPPPDARHDWQIYAELLRRLDPKPPLKRRLQRFAMRRLGPEGLLALALRFGPYGPGWKPFGQGITLRRLRARPHGVDLGALRPAFPERLRTEDRRIHVAPAFYLDDMPRLVASLEEPAGVDDLVLIGRRQVRSNNSWMHNVPRLMRGKDRCTLLLHPDDAARCELADGELVRVRSRVGAVTAPAEVSDEMMAGVVSLPHGWGHRRRGTRLHVAEEHPGASINDLTDACAVDPLCGTAAFSGVPVEIERAAVGRVAKDTEREAVE